VSIIQAERPVRSERKARGHGHLRRAELLAAAQRIFTVSGYEGATIRKIADEVGVSSTALYMYFQDKSQIMLEICVHALEGLCDQMEQVVSQTPEPHARLRRILEVTLRFGFEQPTAYQLLYCVVPKDVNERREAVVAPFSRACFARVVTAIEASMAAGKLRTDMAARPMAEAMIGACHGAISMRIANPNAPWTEPEVLSKILLDGLFQGFNAD
jgi:AcrR family transcriptional regulator